MMLGTLISRLSNASDASLALEALDDVVLFAKIDAMAMRFGESASEYVSASAARFAAMASDEEWLSLMSALERAADPAQAVLVRMVRWGLSQDARDEADEPLQACSGACGCS